MTDAEIAKAYLRRPSAVSKAVEEELYRRLFKVFKAAVYRIELPDEDRKDCICESMVSALEGLDSWRGSGTGGSLYWWAYKIARHKALNWVAHRKSELHEMNLDEGEDRGGIIDRIPDSAPTPDQLHRTKIRDTQLRELLADAPPELQKALTMVLYGHARSLAKAAKLLGMDRRRVYKMLNRCNRKEKIKKILSTEPAAYKTLADLQAVDEERAQ
jgi:RNA polymerase sigma factor (sigma-70 family)